MKRKTVNPEVFNTKQFAQFRSHLEKAMEWQNNGLGDNYFYAVGVVMESVTAWHDYRKRYKEYAMPKSMFEKMMHWNSLLESGLFYEFESSWDDGECTKVGYYFL